MRELRLTDHMTLAHSLLTLADGELLTAAALAYTAGHAALAMALLGVHEQLPDAPVLAAQLGSVKLTAAQCDALRDLPSVPRPPLTFPSGEADTWIRLLSSVLQQDLLGRPVASPDDPIDVTCLGVGLPDEVTAQPTGLFEMSCSDHEVRRAAALTFATRHQRTHGHQRVVFAASHPLYAHDLNHAWRELFGASVGFNPRHAVVITTARQVMRALLGNTRRDLRLLAFLQGSVLILDQPHVLPLKHLDVTLQALEEFAHLTGMTVLFAHDLPQTFRRQLPGLTSISVPPVALQGGATVRPHSPIHVRFAGTFDLEELAVRLEQELQVLCVTGNRKSAAALARLVPDALMLSRALCGEHRQLVLQEAQRRLTLGEPVRLFATHSVLHIARLQFEQVWHTLAPLEELALVARASRSQQDVRVFEVIGEQRPRENLLAEQLTRQVLREAQGRALTLEDLAAYYTLRMSSSNLDTLQLRLHRQRLLVQTVAERYAFYDDPNMLVAVPFDDEARRLARHAHGRPLSRAERQRLRGYTAALSLTAFQRAVEQGKVVMTSAGAVWLGGYDRTSGIAEPLP
ncbi:hypothetical protein [Deinococcus pimensis]|uniref:hypothetical protein n=1 Tax=Deinococcus pimensis TaxID=309888 RepID=UPI000488AD27|nr:hypothetical protein [Deinococcus pimensis]